MPHAGEGRLVVGDRPESADPVDLGAASPHGPLQLIDHRTDLAFARERGHELLVGGNTPSLGKLERSNSSRRPHPRSSVGARVARTTSFRGLSARRGL
jgi:hypothetical protein